MELILIQKSTLLCLYSNNMNGFKIVLVKSYIYISINIIVIRSTNNDHYIVVVEWG